MTCYQDHVWFVWLDLLTIREVYNHKRSQTNLLMWFLTLNNTMFSIKNWQMDVRELETVLITIHQPQTQEIWPKSCRSNCMVEVLQLIIYFNLYCVYNLVQNESAIYLTKDVHFTHQTCPGWLFTIGKTVEMNYIFAQNCIFRGITWQTHEQMLMLQLFVETCPCTTEMMLCDYLSTFRDELGWSKYWRSSNFDDVWLFNSGSFRKFRRH